MRICKYSPMDITKILDLKYIFIQDPFPLHPFQLQVLISVFSIFTLAAIIAWFWGRAQKEDLVNKKVATKFSTFCFTLGLIGWVLFFMRQTRVYFFDRRFWLIFWGVGTIVWFFFLAKYILKKAPTARKSLKERREFEKYLPRKKH